MGFGFLFVWVTYTSPSTTVSPLYCIVWMDVSISAARLIFGDIYNLLPIVGTGCAWVVSGAIWTLQHRLALLPLCPWAGSWSTSALCDQRGSSTYLAPCSSFIFTVGNEARLFILTIKGNLNDTSSPSASSLRLVYNEP